MLNELGESSIMMMWLMSVPCWRGTLCGTSR